MYKEWVKEIRSNEENKGKIIKKERVRASRYEGRKELD